MNCNKCGQLSCNCYLSVPTYTPFTPCPPQTFCGPPPIIPCQVIGLNMLYASISTTNLEFFNMPVTPKTLILAPGPGKLIVPLQMWNFLKFGTTPYTTITPTSVTLLMNLGTTNLVTDLSILGSLSDQTVYYTAFSGAVPNTLANQPLTLSTISQPVVGDSVLYSYIIYTIVSL